MTRKRFCHTFATVFTAFWSIIRDSGYRIPGIISEINYSHLFLQSQDINDAITYDNSEFIALGSKSYQSFEKMPIDKRLNIRILKTLHVYSGINNGTLGYKTSQIRLIYHMYAKSIVDCV